MGMFRSTTKTLTLLALTITLGEAMEDFDSPVVSLEQWAAITKKCPRNCGAPTECPTQFCTPCREKKCDKYFSKQKAGCTPPGNWSCSGAICDNHFEKRRRMADVPASDRLPALEKDLEEARRADRV